VTPGCWYDRKITYDEYLEEMHGGAQG